IQKVLGATPSRLFLQHLTEAFLVCGTSLLLSVPIAANLVPFVNNVFGLSLTAAPLLDPEVVLALLSFGAVVAVLAGGYPALVLSRFRPSTVLKGGASASGIWLRKSLVVLQFFISVGLIICTLVLQEQLDFIRDRNLGFDKDHVIVLRMDRQTVDRLETLREEFLQNAQVESVTLAYETPTFIEGGYSIAPTTADENGKPVRALPADHHFLETFDIEVVAGQGLSEGDVELARRIDQRRDTTSSLPIVINASQARSFGWTPEEAIGRRVRFQGTSEIKGVVRDFHFASLHEPIGNLVIFPSAWGNSLMVKLDGREIASTLAFLEARWRAVVPHRPFTYHFLDDEFDQMYGAEIRMTHMARAFSGVAMILACLGLFGLASFSIVQRTKEIGIRKVLGATVPNLVAHLSGDFLKLVVVGFAAAIPIVYLAMQRWLEDFAYRTEMSWWIFALAGAGAVVIALLTVIYQASRAALADPVKSLRYE
ncbi:MAG: FtsX-like permease family protein, partial [Rhodothermales bacterium]